MSSIPRARSIDYLKYQNFNCRKPKPGSLTNLCSIPDSLYQAFAVVSNWNIPQFLTFKITNPGQQMTNTFHSIVLADNNEWYKGEFYTL